MYKRLQNIAFYSGTNAIGVQISYSIHSFSLQVISTKGVVGIHIEQNVDIKELKAFCIPKYSVVITIDGKL